MGEGAQIATTAAATGSVIQQLPTMLSGSGRGTLGKNGCESVVS